MADLPVQYTDLKTQPFVTEEKILADKVIAAVIDLDTGLWRRLLISLVHNSDDDIIDKVGTFLAGLTEFEYDAATKNLTFTLTEDDIPSTIARANALMEEAVARQEADTELSERIKEERRLRGQSEAAETKVRSDADNALRERLDIIPVYAGIMEVWPPNVRKHSDFQRRFQSTLSGLVNSLATDAGATGTRFANVFRIFTQNADGAVVQLHSQGWAITNDERQTIEWEVSAAEFNQLGLELDTNGIEIWGEFRAIYGGGVDEFRGRTNPVFIDFGEQDEWPATRGEVDELRSDPLHLLGGLEWEVSPTRLSGRKQADFQRTIRIDFETPISEELNDYWYDVSINFRGKQAIHGFSIKSRAKWVHINELEIVVNALTAGNIANNVRDDADHVRVNIAFYSSENSRAAIANISRRLSIVEQEDSEAELTTAQKIALLNFQPESAAIEYANQAEFVAALRPFNIRVTNPELLDGDVWVEGQFQGGPALARTKWSSATSVLRLNPAQAWVEAAFGNLTDASVDLTLTFYDAANAGNELEVITIPLAVIQKPLDNNLIQAWDDSRSTNNLVLPANYAEYSFLSLAWVAGTGGNVEHRFRDIPIAILANLANTTFRGSGGSDFTWARNTRTLTVTGSGNQNTPSGIKYGELID